MSGGPIDPIVREIEDAFVAHWSLLGQWPGASLVDEDGVMRFETPLTKLPYNGVIRTRIEDGAAEVAARVAAAYADRGSNFFWAVHPSSEPDDLADVLAGAGLELVEIATGMSLDLEAREPVGRSSPSSVGFEEVVDEVGLRAYTDVSIAYWELEETDRDQVEVLNRHWFGERARGHRWLALNDGRVVGKGYLSVAGPPGVASIYGMSVLPEARGMGVAGALTETLVAQAKELGCKRVVLHSSEMATGVYRRAGFVERCKFRFFATAPIWSGQN